MDWEETAENFRSKKEIIHFNNEFFSKIKHRLSKSLIDIYKNHNQNSNYANEGGCVRIELFEGANYREEILNRIFNEIELILKKKYSYKDITILCNTHNDIAEVAEFLSFRNIPIVSNDGLSISKSLEVKGRYIVIENFYEKVIKFDFEELCNRNLGSEDYIKIADNCEFIFITNLPDFNENNSDQQQRFITLIDIIYEKKIPLMITSQVDLNMIKSSRSMIEPFKRTVSRLYELTSINYN